MPPRVGMMFAPQRPIRQLPDVARQAEELGYEQLWLAEDCFLHGGLTAAGAALAVSERLAVGVGLLPVSVRNPAIGAMEIATLANLYPGRFIGGFGHGVEWWMRQIGARPRDRIVALREVVDVTRRLLAGETITVAGKFVTLEDVTLEEPPSEPPPLLIGTTGERGLAVAGEVSDGVVLPEGAGPAAVAWARERAGEQSHIVVYAWARVDDDGTIAREAMLPTLRPWRERGKDMYANLIRVGGLEGELGVDDVARVAIAGTPEECAEAIIALGEAGAASVIVLPTGPDATEQLERIAREVLPRLAG